MPCYDVRCATCGHSETQTLKIADLEAWDAGAECPQCRASNGLYARVILQAPIGRMRALGVSEASRARVSAKAAFSRSSEKADMMHRSSLRVDHDQKAACLEGAKKGDT